MFVHRLRDTVLDFKTTKLFHGPVVEAICVTTVSGPTSVFFSDTPTRQGSRWNNLIWEFRMGGVTVSVSCCQPGHQQHTRSEMVLVHTLGDIHLHAFHFYSQSGTYG